MSNHASNPIIRDRAKYAVHNNLGRLILIHLIQVSLILVLTLIPIFLFAQDVVDAFSVASTYSDTFIKSYPLAFLTSLKPFFQMMGVLLLEFALFAPCLVAGYQKALIDMARGGRPSVGTLFCRFRNFFGCIGLDLWISLKLLLWALPAFGMTIVGFIIGILAKADWLIAILPFLWMIAAFALLIPASYRYSMASCFYADNPSMGVFAAVNRSKAMMRCRKWQLFKLTFLYRLLSSLISEFYGMISDGLSASGSLVASILSLIIGIAAIVCILYLGMRTGMSNACFYEEYHISRE